MSYTVLVVDDEPNIVEILEFNLKREGYTVLSALDGRQGLSLALSETPDLILLDVMLPGLNGFEVCREIREKDHLTPILMLTAREEERDKILGLEFGADDYIVKPFSVRELMARVKTNMRRNSALPSEPLASDDLEQITCGRLKLDPGSQSVMKGKAHIDLTLREYELLRFMAKSPGKLFTREELMAGVWNYDYTGDARLVDVAIRRLREKLEDSPKDPKILITKRGIGYYIAG